MTKMDWERLQRKDKASKDRELPSLISGVSIPREPRRQGKRYRYEPKPSPIIPKGKGIGKCHFCSKHYRNVVEHERLCQKNPAARVLRAKLKKISHQRKLASKRKTQVMKKRIRHKINTAGKSLGKGTPSVGKKTKVLSRSR